MTVVQVCSASGVGGGEVHVAGLCRLLAGEGVAVRLFHRKNAGIPGEFAGVFPETYVVAPRNSLDVVAVWKMAGAIRRLRADIVHAHMARDWFPVALAVMLSRIRGGRAGLVLSRHHLNRVGWNPAKRIVFGKNCRVIAVSRAVAESLFRSSAWFRHRTTVIHNWTAIPETTAPEKTAGDIVRVACIGRITPEKDQLAFVRAANLATSASPERRLEFHVIGSPGKCATDREYAARLKADAGDNVIFTPHIPGIAARLHEFDIVAVPSLSEAFPLILLEAMAAGRAVVASDVGGMPEIVDTPDIGRLFPVCDERALAGILTGLAKDDALRLRLGSNARESVRVRFAPEIILPQILEIYRESTRMKTPAGGAPRKILFCKLRYIGDTLLMTGTIRATKRAFPGANIWVAVREGTEGILAGCPEIDRIVTFAAPKDRGRSGTGFWRDLRGALNLRRERFDIVFELGSSDRGRHVAALCGAKKRVANRFLLRSRFWRSVFSGSPSADCLTLPAAGWDMAPVAAWFGWSGGTCPPPVFDRTRADFSFLPPAPDSRPRLVVHPVAGKPEKLWPEERWARVVSRLAERFDIVLSCGPAEAEIAFCRRIASVSGVPPERIIFTEGRATWAQLAGVLYSSSGYIGGDTAAMHLASACGRPVFAVFGHADAFNLSQWTPVGPGVRVVTFSQDETSIRDIPTARVLAALDEWIATLRDIL